LLKKNFPCQKLLHVKIDREFIIAPCSHPLRVSDYFFHYITIIKLFFFKYTTINYTHTAWRRWYHIVVAVVVFIISAHLINNDVYGLILFMRFIVHAQDNRWPLLPRQSPRHVCFYFYWNQFFVSYTCSYDNTPHYRRENAVLSIIKTKIKFTHLFFN